MDDQFGTHRLPFFHKALLKLGISIMFIIVSIFSGFLCGNSGDEIDRFLHVISYRF